MTFDPSGIFETLDRHGVGQDVIRSRGCPSNAGVRKNGSGSKSTAEKIATRFKTRRIVHRFVLLIFWSNKRVASRIYGTTMPEPRENPEQPDKGNRTQNE